MRRHYSCVARASSICFTQMIYRFCSYQPLTDHALNAPSETKASPPPPPLPATAYPSMTAKKKRKRTAALTPTHASASEYLHPQKAFRQILLLLLEARTAGRHTPPGSPSPASSDTSTQLRRLVEAVEGNLCFISLSDVATLCHDVVALEEHGTQQYCYFRTALLPIEEEMLTYSIYALSRNVKALAASTSSLKVDVQSESTDVLMTFIREVTEVYRFNEGRATGKDMLRQELISQVLIPSLSLYFQKEPQAREKVRTQSQGAMEETSQEICLWLLLYYTCFSVAPTAAMRDALYQSMQTSLENGITVLERMSERLNTADAAAWEAVAVTDMVERVLSQMPTIAVYVEDTTKNATPTYVDFLVSFVEKGFYVFRKLQMNEQGPLPSDSMLVQRWVSLLHKVLNQWGAVVAAGDSANDLVRHCHLTKQTERLVSDGICFLCMTMGSDDDTSNHVRRRALSDGAAASHLQRWCELSDLAEFYRRTCAVSVVVPSARHKRLEACEPLLFRLMHDGLHVLMSTSSPSAFSAPLPFLILFMRLWQSWLPLLTTAHVQTLAQALLCYMPTAPPSDTVPSEFVYRASQDASSRAKKKVQDTLSSMVLSALRATLDSLSNISPTPADTLTLLVESTNLLTSATEDAAAPLCESRTRALLFSHTLLQRVLHSATSFVVRLRDQTPRVYRLPLSKLQTVDRSPQKHSPEERSWDHTFLSAWLTFCAHYSGMGLPSSQLCLREEDDSGGTSCISGNVPVGPQSEEPAKALLTSTTTTTTYTYVPVRAWCAMDDPHVTRVISILNATLYDAHTLEEEMDLYMGVLLSQLVEACEPSGFSWRQLVAPPVLSYPSPTRLACPQPFLLSLCGLPVSPLRAPAASSAHLWQRLRVLYPTEGDVVDRRPLLDVFFCHEATKTSQRDTRHLTEETTEALLPTCHKGTLTHMMHVLKFWRERYASCWLVFTQTCLFSQRARVAAQQQDTARLPLRSVSYMRHNRYTPAHIAYVNTYHLHAIWVSLCNFFLTFLDVMSHYTETETGLALGSHRASIKSAGLQKAELWSAVRTVVELHTAPACGHAVTQKQNAQLKVWCAYLQHLWHDQTYVSAADAYRSLEMIMQQPVAWAVSGLPAALLLRLWWAAYQGENGSWDAQQLEDLTVFYAVIHLLDRLERLQEEIVQCFLWLQKQKEEEEDSATGDGAVATATALMTATTSFLRTTTVGEMLHEQWLERVEKVESNNSQATDVALSTSVFRFSDDGIAFYAHLVRRSPVQEVLRECVSAPTSDDSTDGKADPPTRCVLSDVLLDLSVSSRVLASQLRTALDGSTSIRHKAG